MNCRLCRGAIWGWPKRAEASNLKPFSPPIYPLHNARFLLSATSLHRAISSQYSCETYRLTIASAGTVAKIQVSETTVNFAGISLNELLVTPVKPCPRMGPVWPTRPAAGWTKVTKGLSSAERRNNYPQSHGKIERWHKSLESECIRPGTPLSLEDARRLVEGYVEHYNNVRLIGFHTGWEAPRLGSRVLERLGL